MREPRDAPKRTGVHIAPEGAEQIAYDEARFFQSFYSSTVRKQATDRNTIGAITDAEARFHYNAVENAIIKAWLSLRPPARGPMIETGRLLQLRRRLRALDIGSGTGHWVDFCRDALLHTDCVAVEVVPQMADHLREKYGETVRVVQTDVAGPDFGADLIGGPVSVITAIGVMFHIVDDARWEAALGNLAGVLEPGGVLFVGGSFGVRTANVQFHKTDEFSSWAEFDKAEAPEGSILVNKRVRSLADWGAAAARCGLEIVDVVRTERVPGILTPENDVLVLQHAS